MGAKRYFYADINANCGAVYHTEETMVRADLVSGDTETGDAKWNVGEGASEVTVHRENIGNTVRQTVTLKNTGDKTLTADSLSSLFVPDIGAEGEKRWYEHRFVVHYARMAWQGEAQWHHDDPQDLGLYATYNHGHQSTIRFSSVGSWTTAQIYPMVMLEDKVLGETWYFEIESCANWYIEISSHGSRRDTSLCVMLSAANESTDGWFVSLKPGESFTTVPAVYGKVNGGFEEAAKELNIFKRFNKKVNFPGEVTPVIYNDYMNALWAQPSKDRLLPLIDKAAEVGCEIFCIDAGWFGERGRWPVHNGDYIPYDALFGDMRLQGILDYIKSKNMKPGLWLEIETADINSDFGKAHPECLLTRHGSVIGGSQAFLDYRQQIVRDHIMGVFDRLYDYGVRYIKNDYNHTTGALIDAPEGKSGVQALHEYTAAVMSFVDEVTKKHPDMYIENCGSGGMRLSDGVLSHFYIQSSSDQEYYDKVPSIASGLIALIPPEKTGIWSFPLPVDFYEREAQLENYPIVVDHILPDAASGAQTAFNMVNAMVGAIYLSGRICYADELNTKLIADAVALYKKDRPVIAKSHPVYPEGTFLIDYEGFAAAGLLSEEDRTLMLAVWRIGGEEATHTVDLSKYIPDGANVTEKYPALPGYNSGLAGQKLTVTLPEKFSAAWFEIKY